MQPEGIIAGMDEAGRGSWAGPVVAAAVILPRGLRLPGLNDSKLVPPEKRKVLFKKITAICDYGIGSASHLEGDELGLIHATVLAFQRALENLKAVPGHLLVDGRDRFILKFRTPPLFEGIKRFAPFPPPPSLPRWHG